MHDAPDVIYLYDGSFEGFLCCVFESVYAHIEPLDIWPEDDAEPTLFHQQWIETDGEKAARVAASIPKRISAEAAQLLQCVFLSCMPQKELAMLRFLRFGYRQGARVMTLIAHPVVQPLLAAQQNLLNEAHFLKEFLRFSETDGALTATITPKNFVLPFVAGHFCDRLKTERFLIFDRTHKAAAVYENRQLRFVSLERLELPPATNEEQRFRILWKQFYNTVAIAARENPKCRMTHCPKRFWGNMLEMEDALYDAPTGPRPEEAWRALQAEAGALREPQQNSGAQRLPARRMA